MRTFTSLVVLFFAFGLFAVYASANDSAQQAKVRLQREQFTAWMREHDRVYSNDDFQQRYEVWTQNAEYIDGHNAQEDKQFEVAMNEFGDMSSAEFATYFKGLAAAQQDSSLESAADDDSSRGKGFLPDLVESVNATEEEEGVDRQQSERALPSTWDWRTRNVLTSVKNQGSCGACYTFAAAGAIESLRKIKNGLTLDLSEQQMIDCSGNAGCNGGNMNTVYNYIVRNGGVGSEASYPYRMRQGTCSSVAKVTTIRGYVNVARGSESALQAQVYNAPVSIGLDASKSSFQFYKSGVYYEPRCSSTALDHAVLAVGWGPNYWILKNQWGTGWGQGGYMYLARNRNNHCGVATMASAPAI